MTAVWHHIIEFLADTLNLSETLLVKLLSTIAVFLVYLVFRLIIHRLTFRRIGDVSRKYIARKTLGYVLGALVLVALIRIWVGGLGGLGTYLGLLSAGLAIAMHEPLLNLVGFFYIAIRKPFVTGDRIQIDKHVGDVIDVSLFQFSIVEVGNWVGADQSTGRIIHVPNGWVLKHSTANYTQGFTFIWNELPVIVTFESDWEKAKQMLLDMALARTAVDSEEAARQIRDASRKYMIFFKHLTPIVWTSVVDIGVMLTIRYLCDTRRRRSSAGALWEDILQAFGEHDDIDFAYPTIRRYDNAAEGKSAQRPPASQPPPPG